MTGFNTQTRGGEYRLQFETDNKEYFLLMQEMARRCLDGQPASDAVPVIRCKDCKHWAFTCETAGGVAQGDCRNPRFTILDAVDPTMFAHEFCALGERENNGTD